MLWCGRGAKAENLTEKQIGLWLLVFHHSHATLWCGKGAKVENLTDKQREIIETYGDLIDRELLKNIVLDPDPNNQAAALATLEEAMVLMKKGVGPDEAMDILKKGSRTKQAEGGLSYLMGM